MIRKNSKGVKASALAAVTALVLAACGSGVDDAESETAASDCGSYAIAMHAWVGYTASAQVLTNVAESLGCTITQTELGEAGLTYDAMEAGSIDLVVEDWGGGRWQEWADRGAVFELGSNGNVGHIGMFVPAWMAEEYPDITDSANLNKYAELFVTPESKGKGAWLEGPPGYTTIGEKMISANKLNYTAISTGSEQGLIDAFTKGSEEKAAVLGYWWTPHYLLVKLNLVEVKFPTSDWTDAATASGLTGHPDLELQKLASKKLNDSTDSFAKLAKNFKWTNDDQNAVAADIDGGMDAKAAAQKWIDANADTVASWTK
jgi:glycine betaine/proline transport system substrate-binding protein